MYYDQYEYSSFINAGEEILKQEPDGVLLAPTIPEMTARFTDKLQEREIPYIFIDSNVASLNPLAFFGQKSDQSGYFAARMAMMLGECPKKSLSSDKSTKAAWDQTSRKTVKRIQKIYAGVIFPTAR